MKLIDLTHTFKFPMPTYPGDPEPVFTELSSVRKDGYLDIEVTSGLHVGTHIDAPAHMLAGGKQLTDYPLERFIGRGVLVDARGKRQISEALLRDVEFQPGDIVLVMTGWSQWFRTSSHFDPREKSRLVSNQGRDLSQAARDDHPKNYFENYPIVEESFAQRLVDAGVSLVGFDTPSPDAFTTDEELVERGSTEGLYPIHHLFLEADILIAENVNHLDQLANVKEFEVIALPTKFGGGGAPARVIARINEK